MSGFITPLLVFLAVAVGVVLSLPTSNPPSGGTVSTSPDGQSGNAGSGGAAGSPRGSANTPNAGTGVAGKTPPASLTPNVGTGGGAGSTPHATSPPYGGSGGAGGTPPVSLPVTPRSGVTDLAATPNRPNTVNGGSGTPIFETQAPVSGHQGITTPRFPGYTGVSGVSGPVVGPGSCKFPESWQQGLRWWRGYVSENRDGDEQVYRNYNYEVFSKNSIFVYEQIEPTQMRGRYECLAASTVGKSMMYLMEFSDVQSGGKYLECRQYVQTGNILLLRRIRPGYGTPRDQTGVQMCANIVDAERSYEALPSFDPDTGELPVKRCPFPEAIYQTEVNEQSSGGVTTSCRNVITSRIIIKKATLDVQSCMKEDTYEKPYFSSLYCVADWEGHKLSDRFGSQAASDKSVLLMYGTNTNGDRPHFYIAKYRHEENGVMKLNLYVANRRLVKGLLTATADIDGESYRQFLMKRQADIPNLSLTVTNPTPPQDNCGGCLNGICQQNSGSYQCVCKEGFAGQHCNHGLPSGSCTTNPCKNGAECEQHKQYYYCRCSDIYSGFHCEVPKYCSPNPCKNGECQASLGGYHCLCPEGFTGRTCARHVVLEAEEDKRILIILSTLLSIFGMAIVVVTIIICQCKRKKKDKTIPKNPDGDLPNQTYSSMTSWFPDYKRELAEQEETFGPGL